MISPSRRMAALSDNLGKHCRCFFNGLDERLRRKRLTEIGNAARLHGSHPRCVIVFTGDENHWKGNARRMKPVPHFNTGFIIQIDIQNNATGPAEVAILMKRFSRFEKYTLETMRS